MICLAFFPLNGFYYKRSDSKLQNGIERPTDLIKICLNGYL
ncbi:hypothetical protein HMP0721_0362 [Pseudoramibacter alactolyticus ATCC 23263]|uniref:Uncharacterized protein n=1 Tax=Pseudoramibacter alactolyticus ATCC 23263 TaxID=887929 RepID=E6MEC9_9FIRM|nr:hypothetical protein HMP0721_0362 [Pseudoramibacter alactolyticus ATCC 23263]